MLAKFSLSKSRSKFICESLVRFKMFCSQMLFIQSDIVGCNLAEEWETSLVFTLAKLVEMQCNWSRGWFYEGSSQAVCRIQMRTTLNTSHGVTEAQGLGAYFVTSGLMVRAPAPAIFFVVSLGKILNPLLSGCGQRARWRRCPAASHLSVCSCG